MPYKRVGKLIYKILPDGRRVLKYRHSTLLGAKKQLTALNINVVKEESRG